MAPVQREDDSVYDFLYVDSRRIAHFLAQFSQYGSLTSLTRSVRETSSRSGGLHLAVAKADAAGGQQTSQTRQFDTQWVAPLTFLDEANQRGVIVKGLSQSRIGQVVLVSGALSLFDLGSIKSIWEIRPLKELLLKALTSAEEQSQPPSRRHRREGQRARGRNASRPEEEIGFEMLKSFPHAILACVKEGSERVWATLKEDGLVVAASDLLLKHGVAISGEWTMVGILDAVPDASPPGADLLAASLLGSLGLFIGQIGPVVRGLLGRPEDSYGMTPLLIFREVSV